MSEFNWTAYGAGITLIAGTSMNALGNGSYALGAEIDNGTDKDEYLDIVLKLNSAVAAGAGVPAVDVYLLPCPDGTNYPTPPGGSAGATPTIYLAGSIPAIASANFTIGVLRGVILPPGKFKVEARNNLGVAFPASDLNELKGYKYSEQVV